MTVDGQAVAHFKLAELAVTFFLFFRKEGYHEYSITPGYLLSSLLLLSDTKVCEPSIRGDCCQATRNKLVSEGLDLSHF